MKGATQLREHDKKGMLLHNMKDATRATRLQYEMDATLRGHNMKCAMQLREHNMKGATQLRGHYMKGATQLREHNMKGATQLREHDKKGVLRR